MTNKNQTRDLQPLCKTCGLPVSPNWKTGKTIGERLKLFRLNKRWGVREAARKIKISPATLIRVERGKDTKLSVFMKFCEAYDLEPNQLIGKAEKLR